MRATLVRRPAGGRLSRRTLYIAAPAITWLAYGLLLLPYALIRSVGDDFLPWLDVSGIESGLFGRNVPAFLQDRLYAEDRAWFDSIFFAAHLGWFFIPLAFGLAVTLFERKRLFEYLGWLLAASYISALIYLVLPVKPPWMGEGVTRILIERSFIQYTGVDNNTVAALPSLHAGLPLVIAAFFALRCERLRFLAVPAALCALWIGFAVVYLGEHWTIDVLAGYALTAVVAPLFMTRFAARALNRLPGKPLSRLRQLDAAMNTRPEAEVVPLPARHRPAA